MTNESILLSFYEWMDRQKLSVSSKTAYQRDIKIFIREYIREDVLFENYLENEIMERFIHESKMTSSTKKRRYVSLRKFLEFNREKNFFIVAKDFSVNDFGVGTSNAKTELLTSDEIVQLLNYSPKFSMQEYRNKAIFETLYSTGIRLTELCEIRLKDVDIVLGYMTFHRKNSGFTIPINSRYNPALMEYIKCFRSNMEQKEEEYLFVNRSMSQLSRQSVWKIVSSYSEIVVPNKKITPYGLRKSFAIHMASQGASYDYISNIFGIKDLSFLLDRGKSGSVNNYSDFYKYHPENCSKSEESEEV